MPLTALTAYRPSFSKYAAWKKLVAMVCRVQLPERGCRRYRCQALLTQVWCATTQKSLLRSPHLHLKM
ncbi:hypothetical protein IG631_23767 [Alternaria alternata]|nr:hypothetical protein IG631_23767 [Alternaria alternata]